MRGDLLHGVEVTPRPSVAESERRTSEGGLAEEGTTDADPSEGLVHQPRTRRTV